jgi:hypothetical protein
VIGSSLQVTVFADIFMTDQFCPTDRRFKPCDGVPYPGIENPAESYDSEAHFAPNACGNRASIIETQAKVTIRRWMRPTSDAARESVPMHRPFFDTVVAPGCDLAELSSSSAGCGPREKQPFYRQKPLFMMPHRDRMHMKYALSGNRKTHHRK